MSESHRWVLFSVVLPEGNDFYLLMEHLQSMHGFKETDFCGLTRPDDCATASYSPVGDEYAQKLREHIA